MHKSSTTSPLDLHKYKWLEKGKSLWVTTPTSTSSQDIFTQCHVIDIDERTHLITVQDSNGNNTQVGIDQCLKCTYGPNDVSDMVDLEELNEPELLWNIKRRYDNDLIFTLCGPTLLIINPYRKIEALLTDSVLHEYQALVFSEALEYKSQVPHVFGLAGFSLWQLFENGRNQSIVISGESGAGKTENTKYCLKFLASLGKNLKEVSQKKLSNFGLSKSIHHAMKRSSLNDKLSGIEDRILGCNEILEAFGNAKTIRNDNSSRFGKLIILLYGETKVDIRSSFITNYLLEKSRIVTIAEGERNYHVFYYLCGGASQEERTKYKLTEPAANYHFLNQSSAFEVPGVSNDTAFQNLKREFRLYLTEEEIESVLSIISAILNLGNVEFSTKENHMKEEFIVIQKEHFLRNAAELIGVEFEELSRALQYRKRTFKGTFTESPFRLDEAQALRDSFAKNLYEKLFNFLVFKLNEKIQLQRVDLEDIQNRSARKSIGILDIFGFQILKANSLEQFFINFANEKLQQLYVSYIFKQEQNEFLRQGLEKYNYEFEFADNKPIIELIELYPSGILHIINEFSELNKADSSLPLSISNKHPKNPYISIPKFKNDHFLITHSCNPVEYFSRGFTTKNKDEFPSQMAQVVDNITNPTLKSIITYDADSKLPPAKNKFLATKFLKQINNLIEELYSSDCHFVRCIKPNQFKQPKMFNTAAVLQSLRNLGVLDSIKIRKLGYVYRRPFGEFCRKFYELEAYNFNVSRVVDSQSEEELKEMSRRIVIKYTPKDLENNNILIGHNKILINEISLNNLESQAKEKRRLRVSTANRLKTAFKKHKFREAVSKFLCAIRVMKTYMVLLKERVSHELKVKRAIQVQRAVKKYLIQNRMKKIEAMASKSILVICRWWRMMYYRKKFLEKKLQILKVQSHVRKYLDVIKVYKHRLIRNEINGIINNAWTSIETKYVTIISKIYRGFKTRKIFKEEIKKIQKAKLDVILKLRATRIQKWWRYKLFSNAMKEYLEAAQLIQATFKSYLLRRIYKKVLASASVIQKAAKKHLGKKFLIGKLWKANRETLRDLELERQKCLSSIGLPPKTTKQSNTFYTDEVSSKIQVLPLFSTPISFLKHPPLLPQSCLSLLPIPHPDKNDFQLYILDTDLVSSISHYYQEEWGHTYKAILEQMKSKMEYPISIEVGDNSTTIVTQKGRIYQFGEVHLAGSKEYNVFEKGMPFRVVCNQFEGYVLNTNRQMYTWGDNDSDQLMRGGCSGPCSFAESAFLPVERVDNFEVRGDNRYLISFGRVFSYSAPQVKGNPKDVFKLTKELNFKTRVAIEEIIASYDFVHFLTSAGHLYSKGSNNRGQLGLGHTNHLTEPQINSYLKESKEIIDSVSVGFEHTVVKTRLGYVYVWGDNSFRQISDQPQQYFSEPQKMVPEKSSKASGAVAGFRDTFILLQNFKIFSWGASSANGFQRVDYQKMYQTNIIPSLFPLKLCSTWSRTLSIVYMNAASYSKCKKNTSKDNVIKTIRAFAREWTLRKIFPPYHEMAQNNLNISDLKKYKFKAPGLRPSLYEQNVKNPFREIDMLIQSKTAPEDGSTLSMTAKEKLQEMFKILLEKNSDEEWSEEERRLFEYLQNPKIQKLIRNL